MPSYSSSFLSLSFSLWKSEKLMILCSLDARMQLIHTIGVQLLLQLATVLRSRELCHLHHQHHMTFYTQTYIPRISRRNIIDGQKKKKEARQSHEPYLPAVSL